MNQKLSEYKFQHYLMASYLYYIKDYSIMADEEYDSLCKHLLSTWDEWEHRHKHLVSKGDLEAGTCYKLKERHYPLIVRSSAEQWRREHEL